MVPRAPAGRAFDLRTRRKLDHHQDRKKGQNTNAAASEKLFQKTWRAA
jgi:hypothetical protein